MKSSILAAALLSFLAGSASALAADPAAPVTPLAKEAAPVEVDSLAQPAVAESLPNAQAPAAAATVQEAILETLSEAADTTAAVVQPEAESGPAAEAVEAATPEAETAAEQPAPASTASAVAGGTESAAPAASGKPCRMRGKGGMGKGMDQIGKGPGKPGCDRCDKGKYSKHEQVVRRLDMIEARMAKIETMLESLMQR